MVGEPTVAVPSPRMTMDDGKADTVSPLPSSNVSLGDGTAAVGVPTIDLLNSMAYVGTDQGVIYGVLLPLP